MDMVSAEQVYHAKEKSCSHKTTLLAHHGLMCCVPQALTKQTNQTQVKLARGRA